MTCRASPCSGPSREQHDHGAVVEEPNSSHAVRFGVGHGMTVAPMKSGHPWYGSTRTSAPV